MACAQTGRSRYTVLMTEIGLDVKSGRWLETVELRKNDFVRNASKNRRSKVRRFGNVAA